MCVEGHKVWPKKEAFAWRKSATLSRVVKTIDIDHLLLNTSSTINFEEVANVCLSKLLVMRAGMLSSVRVYPKVIHPLYKCFIALCCLPLRGWSLTAGSLQ